MTCGWQTSAIISILWISLEHLIQSWFQYITLTLIHLVNLYPDSLHNYVAAVKRLKVKKQTKDPRAF